MSEYTKGPWKWESYGGNCCTLDTDERSLVYHAAAWAIPKDARALIAAAPEMYEVLKSMASEESDPMANGDPRRAALLAALKKAEGK